MDHTDVERTLQLVGLSATERLLDVQPFTRGREHIHNVHERAVKEGETEQLHRHRNPLLFFGQRFIFLARDLGDQFARDFCGRALLRVHRERLFEYEGEPSAPPRIEAPQISQVIVDHRGSARRGRGRAVRHADERVDGVGETVGHADESLRPQALVLKEA